MRLSLVGFKVAAAKGAVLRINNLPHSKLSAMRRYVQRGGTMTMTLTVYARASLRQSITRLTVVDDVESGKKCVS